MPTMPEPYPLTYNKEKAVEIWAKLEQKSLETGKALPNKDLHDAVAGNSPFLANIIESLPDLGIKYLSGNAHSHFEYLLIELRAPRPEGETTEQLMASLRQAKARMSLLIAIADISGAWALNEVTSALSQFADLSLQITLSHLFHARMKAGELPWPSGTEEPVSSALQKKTGYFILGMGKLGANELNYSSDIDLIILYDPSRVAYQGRKTLAQCFIKITQDLVQIIDKRTMHGYVFRTDLRLRPDPGATPVALAVGTAESYYHSMAANWERSAMIKARVIAGDFAAGTEFLDHMASWVWRRSMDFVALRDIAAIKNQINHHYDQKAEVGPGFNVKLGYGGIREIEFYTQINQLLHAGRHPSLRIRPTLSALKALDDLEIISHKTYATLSHAYTFFRKLEHRLQMVHDAQTHELPENETEIDHIALFMGYSQSGTLLNEIRYHSSKVSKLYKELLPETTLEITTQLEGKKLISLLDSYSFSDPSASANLINGWRRGRYKAVRTDRAKNLLDLSLPELLAAFAKTHDPNAALIRFDKFISKLPAGVQVFSLLQANPSLFKLLARIMGLAPALADILAKKPDLWDMLLEPTFFSPIEDEEYLTQQLQTLLGSARDFQDILDLVRRFVAEQKFRTGIHLMEGLADVEETGASLTLIADVALKCLIPEVTSEFCISHGEFPGGGIAILAMGKYGGRELTHTSDLDIVFLYHCEDMKAVSDGKKPLAPSQYFSRLGQHIITAVTALTPEGRLFEVDTRLRPSGSQGPLVVTLKTFEEYYASSAWAWEHMALTRARLILAPDKMKPLLNAAVTKVLTSNRDKTALLIAVADMRSKLFSQFGSESIWAIKHCRGGLVDMEFICQYLMLREGYNHSYLFEPELVKSITQLTNANFLSPHEGKLLQDAHALLQKVQALLRLCVGSAPKVSAEIPEGLQHILVQATKVGGFNELEKQVKSYQDKIYKLYIKLIEEPAKAISQSSGE